MSYKPVKDPYLNQAMFEVVEDPIQVEAGGFAKGAKITRLEMIHMLADRVLAKGFEVIHLPTGTIHHVDYKGEECLSQR